MSRHLGNGIVAVVSASVASGFFGALSLLLVAELVPTQFSSFAQLWALYSALAFPLSVATSWGFGGVLASSSKANKILISTLAILAAFGLVLSLTHSFQIASMLAASVMGLLAITYSKYRLGQNYYSSRYWTSSAAIVIDGISRLTLVLVLPFINIWVWLAVPFSSVIGAIFLSIAAYGNKNYKKVERSKAPKISKKTMLGNLMVFLVIGLTGVGALTIWNAVSLWTVGSKLDTMTELGVVFGRTAAIYILVSLHGPILRLIKTYNPRPLTGGGIVFLLAGVVTIMSELVLSPDSFFARPPLDTVFSSISTGVFAICAVFAMNSARGAHTQTHLLEWSAAGVTWVGGIFLFTAAGIDDAVSPATMLMGVVLFVALRLRNSGKESP